MDHCYLLLEHTRGELKPVSYELVSAASAIAQHQPIEITALIIGKEVRSLAESFGKETGINTIALEVSTLEAYHSELYKAVLAEYFSTHEFRFLFTAHSTQGLDLAPALAVRLKAGCVTAVESISRPDDTLLYRRSICSGKLVTQMSSQAEKLVLTLQPGSYQKQPSSSASTARITHRKFDLAENHLHYLETKTGETDTSALKEAKVIVAAGRGIEAEENVQLIRDFAELFPRSAIGGSRPVCDLGWMEYNRQVGVTGTIVAPDLYIACGISGTFQHISGMKGSGFIVAINKDPNAPIFNISDICVEEDVTTFIPHLLQEYEKQGN